MPTSPVLTPFLQAQADTAANQGKPGYDVLGNSLTGNALVADNQKRMIAAGIKDAPGVDGAPPVTPTTISGDKSDQITKNTQKTNDINNDITQNKVATFTGGLEKYNDGSPISAPSDAVSQTDENGNTWWTSGGKNYAVGPNQGLSPEQQEHKDTLDKLQAQSDSAFASQIAAVRQQYDMLIKQQGLINKGREAGTAQALLEGGSSRYAQISSDNTQANEVSQGISDIADLTSKEMSAIASLNSAQMTHNYELANKKLEEIDKIRTDKQKTMDDLQKNIQAGIKDARTKVETRNNAIDDDIRTAILDAQKGGANATQLKGMQDALTNHDYAGAVTAGGDSLSNASGIIGEYNFYKKDAVAHGQVPLSFNDYQTADANRKAKIAAAGVANLDTPVAKQQLSGDAEDVLSGRNTLFNIRQTMGRSNAAAAYMSELRDRIRKADSKFDFVASDAGGKSVSTSYVQRSMGAINTVLPNIDKIVDLSNQVGRVGVKEFDSALQSAGMQFGNEKISNFHQAQKLIADEIGVALGAGSVSDMKLQLGFDVTDPSVTPEVFASNMELVKTFLDNRKEGLNQLRYKSDQIGDNTNTVSTGTSNQIKADESTAEKKVLDYGKTSTGDQEKIRQMVNDGVPYVKIMQAFNIQ